MADKRTSRRIAKRFQVRFWPLAGDKSYAAITADLSEDGVFITSGQVLESGSRVRLAFGEGEKRFFLEGRVARVHRVAPTLRDVQKQGMGIRFLTPPELIGELLPALLTNSESPGTARAGGPRVFYVRFKSLQQFKEAFERDLRGGGFFLRSSDPPRIDEQVTVSIFPPDERLAPVTLSARVVHRFTGGATTGRGAGRGVTGMGIEFVNAEQAVAEIEALLEATISAAGD